MQQDRERGGEDLEERGGGHSAQHAQLLGQLPGDVDTLHGAPKPLVHGPRRVEGQLEGGRTVEVAAPIVDPAREVGADHRLPRGGRVVGVLDRRLGQGRLSPGAEGVVERSELREDDAVEADPVEDQVVQGQVQAVVVVGETHQQRPQQRPAREVVGTPRILGRHPRGLALPLGRRHFAEVHDGQLEGGRGTDHLHRLAVCQLERRAPDLVTPHDLVEGGPEGPDLERAILADRDGLVVDGVLGREPAEVPELLLENRQRRRTGVLPASHRSGRCGRGCGATAQPLLEKGALVGRQAIDAWCGHG